MALLSNRRGGLLSVGPEAIRQAANERRATYMAQPQRPSAIGTPGRPIFVDNPINSAFEGLGSLGKMLGEYGDWQKAEAEKKKREDAIKAAYGAVPTQRTTQTPEALVYKGRGGAGDVIDGGSLMPPQGAKIDPTDRSRIEQDEYARSQGLEQAAPQLGRTYQPQSTKTIEGERQRTAMERAQYFASQGLYDLAAKEMMFEKHNLDASKLGLEAQKLQKELAEADMKGSLVPGSKDYLSVTRGFQNDWLKSSITQDYKAMKQQRDVIAKNAALTDPRKIDDVDLVFAIAKMFDPTSVVREGEQLTIRNAQGLPAVVEGAIQGLDGGTGLDEGTRRSILAAAQRRMEAVTTSYAAEARRHYGLAQRYPTINPFDIGLSNEDRQFIPAWR